MVTMLHSLAPSASRPITHPSELGAKLFAATFWRLVLTPFAHRAPRLFAIIKMQRAVGQNLIVLVALAREQHDVARPRLIHRQRNRFLSILLDQIFRVRLLQPDDDV